MTEEVTTKELTPEQEYALLKNMGGRKFILSMTVVILTSLLTWFGKLEPGIFATVIVAVVGAYVAGNVIQNIQAPKTSSD